MTPNAKGAIAAFFARWAKCIPQEQRKEFMEHIGEFVFILMDSAGDELCEKIKTQMARSVKT